MPATPIAAMPTDTVVIPIYSGLPPVNPQPAKLTRRGRVVRDLLAGGAALAVAVFAQDIAQAFAELTLFVDTYLPGGAR